MNRIAILSITVGLTYGQQATPQAPAPPVTVKRQPPSKGAARPGIPDPRQYPFGQILVNLQAGEPQQTTPPAVPAAADTPGNPASPPKDVPLSASANEALALGKSWMTEKHVPAPGKDGRVLYTFGAGLPTIVCAPLRVCVLELEPGEKMVGEPHIGDSVRWTISPAAAGRPEAQMIVIKPKQAGLDTNLLVTTDRRAYYVRLVSKPEDYLARVAFAYPDDATAQWQQHFRQEEEQRRKQEADSTQIAPLDNIDNLYFDYRISGGDEYLRPVRVVDDGRKTFVQMPPGATVREAPVLVVVGPNGPEMVNYRVKGDMYIADRLFERGALILGVGKKQRRADIVRGTYRGKDAGQLLGRAVTEVPASPPAGDTPAKPTEGK
jgi:P-type conjugative transfer protein TrbG